MYSFWLWPISSILFQCEHFLVIYRLNQIVLGSSSYASTNYLVLSITTHHNDWSFLQSFYSRWFKYLKYYFMCFKSSSPLISGIIKSNSIRSKSFSVFNNSSRAYMPFSHAQTLQLHNSRRSTILIPLFLMDKYSKMDHLQLQVYLEIISSPIFPILTLYLTKIIK